MTQLGIFTLTSLYRYDLGSLQSESKDGHIRRVGTVPRAGGNSSFPLLPLSRHLSERISDGMALRV